MQRARVALLLKNDDSLLIASVLLLLARRRQVAAVTDGISTITIAAPALHMTSPLPRLICRAALARTPLALRTALLPLSPAPLLAGATVGGAVVAATLRLNGRLLLLPPRSPGAAVDAAEAPAVTSAPACALEPLELNVPAALLASEGLLVLEMVPCDEDAAQHALPVGFCPVVICTQQEARQ